MLTRDVVPGTIDSDHMSIDVDPRSVGVDPGSIDDIQISPM